MYSSFELHLRAFQGLIEVYLLSKLNRDKDYFESRVFHKTLIEKSDSLIPCGGFFTKNQYVLKFEVSSKVVNKNSDSFFMSVLTEFWIVWIIWLSMFQALNLHSVRRHNCTHTKLDLSVLSEVEGRLSMTLENLCKKFRIR